MDGGTISFEYSWSTIIKEKLIIRIIPLIIIVSQLGLIFFISVFLLKSFGWGLFTLLFKAL
tara:strand:+ start:312 stop:494 length:183 start_codon:yes stop_codon:yes gene_type:complete